MRKSVLVACTFLLTGALHAQEPPKAPADPPKFSESLTYRPREFPSTENAKKKTDAHKPAHTAVPPTAESKPISLNISVVDVQGRPVWGLTKENLKLFIDGQESDITSVSETSEPVNFIFLLDVSPSAAFESKELTSKALYVLRQLAAGDRAMVMKFDTGLKVLCKLTDDLGAAEKSIQKAGDRMGNGTAVYDHIQYLSEKVIPTLAGRTAVVLFSDGVDTTSKRGRYDTSLAIAEKLDAVFYTVYFDTLAPALATTRGMGTLRGLPGLIFPLPPGVRTDPKQMAREYAIGIDYINDLARMSGGRAIRADALADPTTTPILSIASEVRNRYVVTVNPKGHRSVGQRQQLVVRVERPNLSVFSRGSYIAR